jgi:hypothetical protein
MAPFESDTEVYETLGPLLNELVQDAGSLAQLRRADAVIQYAFRRPDATITVDARDGRYPAVQMGSTDLRADIVLAMDADVGQQLLSGEINPMLALARGHLRTKGPVAKLLRVLPASGARSGEAADIQEAPPARPAQDAVADPGDTATEQSPEAAPGAGNPAPSQAAEAAAEQPAEPSAEETAASGDVSPAEAVTPDDEQPGGTPSS